MTSFVHPAAFVCGRVRLGSRASVWAYAVLRGDSDEIHIGAESIMLESAVVSCDPWLGAIIGARVGSGHLAVVHGCVVEEDSLIGIGLIVLNSARVGAGFDIG